MRKYEKTLLAFFMTLTLFIMNYELFGQTVSYTRCLYDPLVLVPGYDFPDIVPADADDDTYYAYLFEITNGNVTNLSDFDNAYGPPFTTSYWLSNTTIDDIHLEIEVTDPTKSVSIIIYAEELFGPGVIRYYSISSDYDLCNMSFSSSSAGVYCADETISARVYRSYEEPLATIPSPHYKFGTHTNHHWRISYGTTTKKIRHKNATLAANVSSFPLSMSYDYEASDTDKDTYTSFSLKFDTEYQIVPYYNYTSVHPDAREVPRGIYTFYPNPPEVDDVDFDDPTCIRKSATNFIVTYKDIESSFSYVYTITKYLPYVDGNECQNGSSGGYCEDGNVYNYKGGSDNISALNPSDFEHEDEDIDETVEFTAGKYILEIETESEVEGEVLTSCSVTEYEFIVEDPDYTPLTAENINIIKSDPSCNGNNDGSIGFTSTAGVDDGVIKWKLEGPDSYQSTPISRSVGTYNLKVTDRCEEEIPISVTIGVGTTYFPNITRNTEPSCKNNGEVSFTVPSGYTGGGTTQYKLNDDTNYLSKSTFDDAQEGSNTVYMKLDGECESITEFTMGFITDTNLDITPVIADCSSDTQGSILFSNIVKTGDVEFYWEIRDEDDEFVDSGTHTSHDNLEVAVDHTARYSVTVEDQCSALTNDPDVLDINLGYVPPRTAGSISNVFKEDLTCYGTAEGIYQFRINNGTAPFTVGLKNSTGALSDYTMLDVSNELVTMENLVEDSYTITVTEDNCPGQTITDVDRLNFNIVTENGVTESISLASFEIASAADSISCYNKSDGKLTLVVTGGFAYTSGDSDYIVSLIKVSAPDPDVTIDYTSVENRNKYTFDNLSAGTYYPVISDANECSRPSFVKDSIVLINPAELKISEISPADFKMDQTTYYGEEIYGICHNNLLNFTPDVFGGTGAYIDSLDNAPFTLGANITYDVEHNLVVTDAYGCKASQQFTIHNPALLEFDTLHDMGNYGHGSSVECYYDVSEGSIFAEAKGGVGVEGTYTFSISDVVGTNNPEDSFSHTFIGLEIDHLTGQKLYTITVEDVLGCVIDDTVRLTLPDSVIIDNISHIPAEFGDIDIACKTDSATIAIDISGGFISANFNLFVFDQSMNPIDTVIVANGEKDDYQLPAGSYSITAFDDYQCETAIETPLILTEPDILLAITDTIITAPNCIFDDLDEDLGTIEWTAEGGTNPNNIDNPYPYTFSLFDVSGDSLYASSIADVISNTFDAEANGTSNKKYEVWVTDVNGCFDSLTVTMIPDQSPLTVTITEATAPNCYDGTNGLITYEIIDATPRMDGSYDYILSGANLPAADTITHVGTTLTLDTLRDTNLYGAYNIYVVDEYGCDEALENVMDTVLQAPPELRIDSFATIRPSFQYQQDGLLAVKAAGGTGVYNYSLDEIDFVSSTLSDPSFWMVSDTLSDEYIVYLRDDNYLASQHEYCQRTDTLVIPEGRILTFDAFEPISTSCFGATDGVIAPAMLFHNEQPIEAIDYDELTLDWSNLSGTVSGQATTHTLGINPIENLVPDSYQLTASYVFDSTYDFAGDFTYIHTQSKTKVLLSETITVDEPDNYKLAFNQIYDATCGAFDGGISITLSGNSSNRAYNLDLDYLNATGWVKELDDDITLDNLGAGSHQISVGTADGSCVNTYSFTIAEEPVALETTDVVHPSTFEASDGYITLTTPLEQAVYTRIDNGATNTNGLFQNLGEGIYRFQVTSTVSTCQSEELEVRLVEPGELLTQITLEDAACDQNNGTAYATTTGGTPPYTHYWEYSSGVDADSTQLAAGDYVLIVEDAVGDTLITTFAITETPSIELLDLAVSPADCTYPNGFASFKINNGVLPYSVQGITYLKTEIELSDLYAGDTIITVSDSRGCETSIEISVPEQNTLVISEDYTTPTTTCGNTDGALGVTVSGGTLPYSYEWVGLTATTNVLTSLATGSYQLIVTDGHGCSASYTGTVAATDGIQAVQWSTAAPYCELNNGSITIETISGGTAPYSIYTIDGATSNFVASRDAIATTDITTLAAGSYTLEIHDTNGCIYTLQGITLEDDAAQEATHTWEVLETSACGLATGNLIVHEQTGTGPFSYEWYDASNNPLGITISQANDLTAGTYQVKATDAAGCITDIDGILLTDETAPSITLDSKTSSPDGAANGSIVASLSGGKGAPYQYYLNTESSTMDNTTGSFDNLAPDTYSLLGLDQLGCSSDTLSVSILGTEALSLQALAITAATCATSLDGSVTILASGGISPYTYYLETEVASDNITGIQSGIHNIKVVDAISSEVTIAVTVPTLEALALTEILTKVTCEGACNGSANIIVGAVEGTYTVTWEDGNTNTSRADLCPGVHNYTLTDHRNNSCVSNHTITIEEESYLTAAVLEATPPTCYDGTNGSLSIAATGGSEDYSYSWASGNTTATEMGAPGNYEVTIVDDQLGCSITETFTIPNQEQIGVISDIFQPTCFGGDNGTITLILENAPSALVRWDNGQIGHTATNLMAGTYSYEIASSLGCNTTGEVTITEREQLTASTIQVDNSCFNNCEGSISLSITGGLTPYRVQWSNGSTSLNPANLCAGNYNYTVTDNYGCQITGEVIIQEPDELAIQSTVLTDVSCSGGEDGAIDLTVVGGTGDYTYQWSNGETSQDLTALNARDYTLNITDANNCSIRATTYEITEPDPLTIIAVTATHPSCTDYEDGALEITPYGGTEPYTVSWDNAKTGTSISELGAGQHTATITDAQGCELTRNWTLTDPAGMQFSNVSFSDPVCYDDANGTIVFDVVGGSGIYGYSWDNTEADNTAEDLSWGTYTVMSQDSEGCEISRSFTLNNPEIPELLGIEEYYIMCAGGQLYLEPAIDWSSYHWSGPDAYFSDTKTATITEDGEYALTATDEQGCPSTVETYVEVSENPLDVDFIRLSEAVTFEPIIFVDLSIPLPDRISWLLPESDAIVINEQSDVYMELVFTEAGSYEVGIEVGLSNCSAALFKEVIVLDASSGRQVADENTSSNIAVQIWPNPTSQEVQLIFNAQDESRLEVALISADQKSYKTEILEGQKDYLIRWDLESAPSGVYFLTFRQGDQVQTKRIVLQK